jgi:hypothetical protein
MTFFANMNPTALLRGMMQQQPQNMLAQLVALYRTNPQLAQQILAARPDLAALLSQMQVPAAPPMVPQGQAQYRQPLPGGFASAGATNEFPVAGDTPGSYGGR